MTASLPTLTSIHAVLHVGSTLSSHHRLHKLLPLQRSKVLTYIVLQEIEELELDFATMESLYRDQVADAKETVKAAIPHAVYEALQQEVNCLHDKLASQEGDLDYYKRNSQGLGEETLEMRVENNQLMEVRRCTARTVRLSGLFMCFRVLGRST